MNRIVVDPLKVDLIRARERPVADKTDNLGAECGGLIKLQHASGRGESDGCGMAAMSSSVAPAPTVAAPDAPESG
jgi:hypothetical protein